MWTFLKCFLFLFSPTTTTHTTPFAPLLSPSADKYVHKLSGGFGNIRACYLRHNAIHCESNPHALRGPSMFDGIHSAFRRNTRTEESSSKRSCHDSPTYGRCTGKYDFLPSLPSPITHARTASLYLCLSLLSFGLIFRLSLSGSNEN